MNVRCPYIIYLMVVAAPMQRATDNGLAKRFLLLAGLAALVQLQLCLPLIVLVHAAAPGRVAVVPVCGLRPQMLLATNAHMSLRTT